MFSSVLSKKNFFSFFFFFFFFFSSLVRLVRTLHSSSRVLKREERRVDSKLRIHLFDFDALEVKNKVADDIAGFGVVVILF
jgi:hypothetical protein